ncbi:MAG: hypothetical protein WDN25_24940 [Acetobacteraceae bacterium]
MPDQLTLTLRARSSGGDLVPGTLMASPKGRVVYRILQVRPVRRAGDQGYRIRIVCARLSRSEVSDGAVVLPWCVDPSGPRLRHPADPPDDRLVNTDPSERPAALIARIRSARAADDIARVARAARVGRDDGVQHGRDYGPGLRLRPMRGRRRGERLREADVEIEDGPDPDRPNNTVRRARRSDPLVALLRAQTITAREFDAAELLRDELQAAQATIPCTGQSSIHVQPFRRTGVSDRQVNAAGAARRAMAAVAVVNRAVVLWIVLGGTVEGFALYARTRRAPCGERLKTGLGELADHYFGRRSSGCTDVGNRARSESIETA